jgi:Mn2+/Fe2+ NRAMP family transporter
MRLDIRWPLGLLFFITGAMMAIYGAVTHGSAIYEKSLSIDINLIWGLVLLAFGSFMMVLAWKASRGGQSGATDAPANGETPEVRRPHGH